MGKHNQVHKPYYPSDKGLIQEWIWKDKKRTVGRMNAMTITPLKGRNENYVMKRGKM